MERRIARASGHRSDDEARALNSKIQKLTEVLEGVNTEHAMLMDQVKQAEVDLGEAKRTNNMLQVGLFLTPQEVVIVSLASRSCGVTDCVLQQCCSYGFSKCVVRGSGCGCCWLHLMDAKMCCNYNPMFGYGACKLI